MPYDLVSAPSNQEAIMTAVRDFAVAEAGYTTENFTAASVGVSRGVMSLSKGDLVVSFRWEGTDQANIAMYHALAYDSGNAASPWLFEDGGVNVDSGNGTANSTSLASQRRISAIGAGPYIALHLYTDSGGTYVYCVLEYSPGRYRHFGFGSLDKFGDDWTGGEFVYGHHWESGTTSDDPDSVDHSLLLDGMMNSTSAENTPATLHIEGMPGQVTNASDAGLVDTVFGNVWNGGNSGSGSFSGNVDGEGRRRVFINGGARGSPLLRSFGAFRISQLDAFIKLIPIHCWYVRTETSPDDVYYLGKMSDVFHIQMSAFNPGDEITIGSDTYQIFPAVRKRREVDNNEESWNMGIAYKKTA